MKYKKEVYERVWDNCFKNRDDQFDAFDKKIVFKNMGKTCETGWEIDFIMPLGKSSNSANSKTFQNAQPLSYEAYKIKNSLDALEGKILNKKFIVFESNRTPGIGTMFVDGVEKYNYELWQ